MSRRYVYPFPAVIGQESVKKALILNIINPKIGGVLISGEKGTAKSTLVRGLATLMPNMDVIDLPLNITEDRLIGSLDIEYAITNGKIKFESGLLKKAHGNFLYVDEVNLLSEHIVNCLLEVSASGVNKIEREGMSYRHKAEFVLVGTMNPEEGLLRSQFLDRFGLYVEVNGSKDIEERTMIISERIEYEKNPEEFIKKYDDEMEEQANKLIKSRNRLSEVKVSESIMQLASQFSIESNCAGHRAELVIVETAKAIAAFDSRLNITVEDVKEAAELALPHRIRDNDSGVEQEKANEDQEEDNEGNEDQEEEQQQEQQENEESRNQEPENHDTDSEQEDLDDEPSEDEQQLEENVDINPDNLEDNSSNNNENVEDIGETYIVKALDIEPLQQKKRRGSGKRNKTKTDSIQGRYVKYVFPKNKIKDIAFDATVRAAAPFQKVRDNNGLALAIRDSDFREKVREKRVGSTILFVVDASGSMGAKERMKAVKGAILSLLTDAYQKRDKVGMVAFRKDSAELILGITRSVDLAQKCLKELPTGGKTPLANGLYLGYEILKAEMYKNPDQVPLLVVVSDARANVSLDGGNPFHEAVEIGEKIKMDGIQSLVIDSEKDYIKLGLAVKLAEAMDSEYYKLEDLEANHIANSIRKIV